MNARNLCFRMVLRLAIAGTAALAGCAARFEAPGSESTANRNSPVTNPPATDDSMVRVRFRNETTAVVETQFYATNESVATIPDDLFVPANLVTVTEDGGIGVAGSGLLPPGTSDAIDFPCTDNLLLGTTGGRFQDAERGTDLGEGPRRWLEEGAVFDCGATITFTYKEEGDGFTVAVSQD
jgi:hypothetical protein